MTEENRYILEELMNHETILAIEAEQIEEMEGVQFEYDNDHGKTGMFITWEDADGSDCNRYVFVED